ncbi:MAG: ABC transporter ATP-binding protein [Spirochaetes bacterium]|nr:ABC transporter ATP-binding protein [Spirochaetota bacterium]
MNLRTDSVSYGYPGSSRDAVSGVSLDLAEGTALAVIGPNGCGKSTLLSLAVGALVPRSGRVLYGGADRSSLGRRDAAKKLSYLPQIERFTFQLTALEYVMLGRVPWVDPWSGPGTDDQAEACEALSRVGMEGARGRHVTELSGGELQLVRLARCLAQRTGTIVLDEPTSMLDPAHSLLLADALRDLISSGKAVLFSTHDALFARYAADFVAIMRDGKLVHSGSSGEALRADRLEEAFGVPFGTSDVPTPFAGAAIEANGEVGHGRNRDRGEG